MMPAHRKKLIISADDFGISLRANERILSLVQKGKIDRVGILANGTISQEEISVLISSNISLDIHLELNDLKSSRRRLREGVFKRSVQFIFKYLNGRVSAGVAEIEWEKQIKKFREIFARNPHGINSHEHLHFFPAYFKIAARLSQKFQIPYLRFGNNGLLKAKNGIGQILKHFHKKDSQLAANFESSEYLVSLDWIKNIESFLLKLPRGKIEIVCHPEREIEFEIISKYF